MFVCIYIYIIYIALTRGGLRAHALFEISTRSALNPEAWCAEGGRLDTGRCKATWKRGFKLPWREAGPPNHHDGKVDSDR